MNRSDDWKRNRRQFLLCSGAVAAALALGAAPLAAHAQAASGGKLRIGVIGSGNIGSTLGGIWVKAGHEVMFSSLDIEHDKRLAASLGANARAGTPREAAAFGEVLLIAVPFRALPQVGKDLAKELKGRIVIDASNPIVSRDGEIATWARDKGAGEASAELMPGARIVRAFNAIGYARLPEFAQKPAFGMPIASDDPKAVAVASRLIREVGLEPVLVGPLVMGKYLIPGTALGGVQTPDQIKQAAATLK